MHKERFDMRKTSASKRTSGLAIASLVLGIVGTIMPIFVIPSILAVIFGILAIRKTKADPCIGGKVFSIIGITLGIIPLILIVYLALSMMSAKHWMPISVRTQFFRGAFNFRFLLNMEDFEVTDVWSQYLCFGGWYGLVAVRYDGSDVDSREVMRERITTICESQGWALAEDPAEYLEFFQEQLFEYFREHVPDGSLGSSTEDLVFEEGTDDLEKGSYRKSEIVAHIGEDYRTVTFYCDGGR